MAKPIIGSETAKTLPAPFGDVQLDFSVSEARIYLQYIGAAERLIAAGAVEPSMTESIGRNNKARFDSNGEYYHREARWTKGTQRLLITRVIMNETHAANLPGVRLPSFERLDWLDANPGRLHVGIANEECMDLPNRIIIRRTMAGTAAALIAAGVSESLFTKPFGRPAHGGCTYDVWSDQRLRLTKLLRGYFQTEEKVLQDLPARSHSPSVPRRASHLRLAWSNPAMA